MKVVSYNISLGFNGKSIMHNMISHFYLRVLKSGKLVKKRVTYISEAMDLALSYEPDILCFNEILPSLVGPEVRQKLTAAGFVTVAEGGEKRHAYPLEIATFLAVREEAETIPIDLPHLDETGGGGGICGLYLPGKNMTVFGVHLGLSLKKRMGQLQVLSEYIALQRILKRKVILAGDFNCSLTVIQNHPAYIPLDLQGCDVSTNTYSRMPLIGRMPVELGLYPDLDHVLWSREFRLHQAVSLPGSSDHDLVFCELQESVA